MIVTLNKQSLELIDKRILLITAVRKKMITAFADATKYQTIPKWYEFKVKRARREAYKEARDLHDLAGYDILWLKRLKILLEAGSDIELDDKTDMEYILALTSNTWNKYV